MFQRRNLISNSDQEMYVLRLRKPHILECEVPPSPGLWRGEPLPLNINLTEKMQSATNTRLGSLPASKTPAFIMKWLSLARGEGSDTVRKPDVSTTV